MSIEAMKLALDTLEDVPYMSNKDDHERLNKAVDTLRIAIEQAEKQEPVAWPDAPKIIYLQVCEESDCDHSFDAHDDVSWCQNKINESDIPYIRADNTPPQREWQGLTENEIKHLWYEACQTNLELTSQLIVHLAKNIEAKLREKNA